MLSLSFVVFLYSMLLSFSLFKVCFYFEFHFWFSLSILEKKNSQELPRISDCGGGSPWLESVGDELDSGFLGATPLDISNLIDIRKQEPALTFIFRSPLSLCMLQASFI